MNKVKYLQDMENTFGIHTYNIRNICLVEMTIINVRSTSLLIGKDTNNLQIKM